MRTRVEVAVWLASEGLRHRLAEKYGEDVVVIEDVLEPVG